MRDDLKPRFKNRSLAVLFVLLVTVCVRNAGAQTCALPATTISAPSSLCSHTHALASVLDAGPGATYAWTITGGSIVAGQSTDRVIFTSNAFSSQTAKLAVTVTTESGCSTGATDVQVNGYPTPRVPAMVVTTPAGVRAVDDNAIASEFSNVDLATTYSFTDDPLTSGTVIKLTHLSELRQAADSARALAGLSAFSFTAALGPGLVPRAAHITDLQTAIAEVHSALGMLPFTYSTVNTGSPIRASEFTEIRDSLK